MNYDGPSFYRKRELGNQDEKSQEIETPLDRLKKEQKRRSRLSEENLSKQKRKEPRPASYYFRSTQIPESLQNRDGWQKETWDQALVNRLEERLKKDPADYLLFSDELHEEVVGEGVSKKEANTSKEEKSVDTSAEAMRIKKMVDEIESTLDTAALVQHELKPDMTKPNTGLHRTLSDLIKKDNERPKGKK